MPGPDISQAPDDQLQIQENKTLSISWVNAQEVVLYLGSQVRDQEELTSEIPGFSARFLTRVVHEQ